MPKREQPIDRLNQKMIAARVQKHKNVVAVPLLGEYSDLDFAFLKPGSKEIVALAEIKQRNHRHGAFPSVFLNAGKIARGSALVRHMVGVEFWVVIEWSCGSLGIHSVPDGWAYEAEWTGRIDRGDTLDKGPACHITTGMFEMLATKPD